MFRQLEAVFSGGRGIDDGDVIVKKGLDILLRYPHGARRVIRTESDRRSQERLVELLDSAATCDGRSVMYMACVEDVLDEDSGRASNGSLLEVLLRMGLSPDPPDVGKVPGRSVQLMKSPVAFAAEASELGIDTLRRLLAVRASLFHETTRGERSIISSLPRDSVALSDVARYVETGPASLAELAKRGKTWAVVNLLRRHLVFPGDLIETYDGRNVLQHAGALGDWDLVDELQFWARKLLPVNFNPRNCLICPDPLFWRADDGSRRVEMESRRLEGIFGQPCFDPPTKRANRMGASE